MATQTLPPPTPSPRNHHTIHVNPTTNTATIPPRSHVVPMAGTPCQLTPIATEEDFNHQISQLPPSCLAAIYFHAPWAEPCLQMNTILTTLATTYQATNPPRIVFLSLNAEDLSDVSERYDVTQVPLVVFQKDGKVLDSVTGTDPTKLRNAVERHVNGTAGGASLPPAQSVSQQANGNGTAKTPNAAEPVHAASEANGELSKEALNQRLSELVKAAPVMLFMKGTPSAPQCGFSRQTVGILREKGVRYGFFNILADDEVRQGLKEFSEWPTFPQVYVDGELVGGLDILKEEFENDADFLKSYSVHAQKQAA